MYVCVSVCVCMYACMYVCMYVCIYLRIKALIRMWHFKHSAKLATLGVIKTISTISFLFSRRPWFGCKAVLM